MSSLFRKRKKDVFDQRRELALALCEALGIRANQCTELTLEFKRDGSTEAVARIVPHDLRPVTEIVRRLELFPQVLSEEESLLPPGVHDVSAVDDAATRRVWVTEVNCGS